MELEFFLSKNNDYDLRDFKGKSFVISSIKLTNETDLISKTPSKVRILLRNNDKNEEICTVENDLNEDISYYMEIKNNSKLNMECDDCSIGVLVKGEIQDKITTTKDPITNSKNLNNFNNIHNENKIKISEEYLSDEEGEEEDEDFNAEEEEELSEGSSDEEGDEDEDGLSLEDESDLDNLLIEALEENSDYGLISKEDDKDTHENNNIFLGKKRIQRRNRRKDSNDFKENDD